MATSTISDDVFIWSNLLTASVVFQALTWVFQIMPLFFFAGVAACVDSWRPGTSWGNWLLRRCTRLYRPVFYYLAFWVSALAILRHFLPEHVYEPVAGISLQLLWFLGAYVLVLAAVPLLARITTTARLLGAVAGTYAFIAVIDAIRINADGADGIGLPQPGRLVDPGHARRRLPPKPPRRPRGAAARRCDVGRQPRADMAGPLRTQPCRHRDPAVEEHDAAIAAAGRSRNHDVRVRDCRCARDRAVGAAAAGVVADRDRQLRGDDAVPVAHPGAAVHASGLRLPRPSAL